MCRSWQCLCPGEMRSSLWPTRYRGSAAVGEAVLPGGVLAVYSLTRFAEDTLPTSLFCKEPWNCGTVSRSAQRPSWSWWRSSCRTGEKRGVSIRWVVNSGCSGAQLLLRRPRSCVSVWYLTGLKAAALGFWTKIHNDSAFSVIVRFYLKGE